MKARKGDLVVIEKTSSSYIIGQGSQVRTSFEFGVVASATRDGIVKTWRSLSWGEGDLLSDYAQPVGRNISRAVPASEIDVPAVLAAAKAHHWPGHPGQPMPFDSLAEARECARPFSKVVSP